MVEQSEDRSLDLRVLWLPPPQRDSFAPVFRTDCAAHHFQQVSDLFGVEVVVADCERVSWNNHFPHLREKIVIIALTPANVHVTFCCMLFLLLFLFARYWKERTEQWL